MASSPGASQRLITIAPALYALQFIDRAPDQDSALATICGYIDQARADPGSLADLPLGGTPQSGDLPMAYVVTGAVAGAENAAALLEFEPDVSDDPDVFQWQLETGFPFCLAMSMSGGIDYGLPFHMAPTWSRFTCRSTFGIPTGATTSTGFSQRLALPDRL